MTKKSLLTGAGLIGACAACCAIPILVPLVSGFSVAALATANFGLPGVSGVPFLLVLGSIGAIAGGLMWRAAKERKGGSCGSEGKAPQRNCANSGCGCT